MFSDPFVLLITLVCLAVAGVLAFGIGNFARGSKDHGKRSNKLMQWRLGLQFVAIVLIALFIYLRRG